MSKLSFISFCIEHYAQHTHKSSDEVLDLLKDDYDDLHGMSMEYMMQMIDEYLGAA